jgi:acetylornithine deacetylase/succinyl-diaminopimelate desuccinylase-like protein
MVVPPGSPTARPQPGEGALARIVSPVSVSDGASEQRDEAVDSELLADLLEWMRIPSISTEDVDPGDLQRAAEWVCERVRGSGGSAELVRVGDGNPLVVGELAASHGGDVPTVLIYGHYDVQGPGPAQLWDSPPFQPEVRDGRLYGRGSSDDKGNFLPLLRVACELAAAGELPVDVRVLVEGEEERGSEAADAWLAGDERGADVAIVFDSAMADARTPAITLGLRGIVMLDLRVRAAARNLHSGVYGGSVLNALHALHAILGAVAPGPDGIVREELHEGVLAPSGEELESWKLLPDAAELFAEAGARPVSPSAAADYYRRNGAEPSLEINRIEGGEARTVVPAVAEATISLRLAPGQDPARMRTVLESLLREAAPPGAELEVVPEHDASPILFSPEDPAVKLASRALEQACGVAPALVRTGGSIPVVASMAARGYTVIVSGFALPEDQIHGPNESFALRSLALGEAAARALYSELAKLDGRRNR